MRRQRSLPGFDDRSPPDRYCDLVLTGGVTSAIAYPGVVHGLAQAYRFNAIGGSSSGAGSAALAAAAEYRRRHGSTDGFRTMVRRTAAVADDYAGRTGLEWLFQPDPSSRRLFTALVSAFAGPKARSRRLVGGLLSAYGWSLLLGLSLGVTLVLGIAKWSGTTDYAGSLVAAVLSGMLLAVCCAAHRLLLDVEQAADADYGLCSGQQCSPGAPHPPLTPWLHSLIQDIAGLPADRPLTFADLHAAPGGPRETLADMSPAGRRSIDLRMFTANVSLGRPLLLPQQEGEPPLYFRPAELRRLFPGEVVDFMKTQARSSPRHDVAEADEPCRAAPGPRGNDPEEWQLWQLPRNELPVLVASRMSVSFPVLFSAVPLWERKPAGIGFRRLLFADGGLCSNFPIHLFDSPVPAWPTFGVALHDQAGEASLDPASIARRVRVPQASLEPGEHQRPRDRWNDFDAKADPYARLLGFVGAMFSTVKDWNDALLAELPGVRERVAEVGLPDDIGGLNILMTAEQIECLALLGAEVPRQLLPRYAAPDQDGAQARGWREHRWVRFNVLAECLHDSLVGLSRAARFTTHAEPLREQLRRAVEAPPLAGEPALQPAQAAALERALEALLQIERALTPRPVEQPNRPVPRPELRVRPPM